MKIEMSALKRIFIVVNLLLMCGAVSSAAVKLPRLISNGMVLQRDVPLNIWGWADAGEKVTVQFQGKSFGTKADKSGRWQVVLPAYVAGGPHMMKINQIELLDILIGDVWLCSGQSNMELPMRRVLDLYQDEIVKAHNPFIRLFRPSNRNDFDEPQADYNDGAWLPATSPNLMDFSAVAYFFADDLYQSQKVPIGLISTAIGGSPAESWLSPQSAKTYRNEWLKAQASIDSIRSIKKRDDPAFKLFNWVEQLNRNDIGVGHWSKADVNAGDWPVLSLPGYWTDKGVSQKTGSFWFYKEFEIADTLAAKEAVLRLGRIIDSDSAFVNGVFVGTVSYQYPPRIYKIPAGLLKPGKNKLMVRVICQGGKGGFVEEKPYEIRIGSQRVDLTGDWRYRFGGDAQPPSGPGNLQFMPGGLYNGLIRPVAGNSLKGAIWYQGESNIAKANEYEHLFKTLILDWRRELGQANLPFLYVQLANLGRPYKQPYESGWAQLREAQRLALTLPQTGMAVTFDIGEWNDIHPLNKKEVARRLALEALRVAYGDTTVVSSGPLLDTVMFDGNSALLTFSSVGSGLFANSYLEGFQVAGPDGRFVWAKAVVLSKNCVRVWSQGVAEPRFVRYAWEDNPLGVNLMNKEGLPASSFQFPKNTN